MLSQQSIVWWWVKVFIFTIHPGAEFSVWSLNHPVLPRVFNQLHQIHQASANSKETLLVCGAVPLWHHEGIRWNHQSSSNFFPCQRSLLDKICSQTLSLHSTKGSCQTPSIESVFTSEENKVRNYFYTFFFKKIIFISKLQGIVGVHFFDIVSNLKKTFQRFLPSESCGAHQDNRRLGIHHSGVGLPSDRWGRIWLAWSLRFP